MKHFHIRTNIFILSVIIIATFAPADSKADKKYRVHFVAASFSYAKDEAQNSALSSFSSRAGYDAVWESSAPEQFPTFFPKPKRISASGLTQYRTKSGIGNCDSDLTFDTANESRLPGVNIYKYDGNVVGIKIVAPHASFIESSAASPCNGPLFVNYANGEGVTTTTSPSYSDLPNDAGSSSPPDIVTYAAVKLDAKNPSKTVNFSFVQTANFPQLLYTSKSVWFGFVTIEEDPQNQAPSAIDPLKLFNYSPPTSFEPPPDPPTPNNSGGGGGSGGSDIKPTDIKKWIKDPIIKQVVDALQGLQQIWESLSGTQSRSVNARLYTDPGSKFTYEPATRVLTLLSVASAPADGTASFKIGVGDGNPKSAAKGISVSGSSSQNLSLTLPTALEKAFSKGKKFSVTFEASFAVPGDKKAKGSGAKKFSVKKR